MRAARLAMILFTTALTLTGCTVGLPQASGGDSSETSNTASTPTAIAHWNDAVISADE